MNTSQENETRARAMRLRQWIAIVAIVLLGAVLRLHAIGRAPLWLDEQCQLAVAQSPTIGECWTKGGALGPIGHLSFFESWIVWHLGGHTRTLFRLPAAIWGIAAIGMVFVLGRRWYSSTSGLFAAGLLAVSGVHIQFSREARGYALLVLLSIIWAWMLDRFMSRLSVFGGVLLFGVAELSLQVHPAFLIVVFSLSGAQVLALLLNFKRSENVTPRMAAIPVIAIAIGIAAVYFCIPRELPLSTTNKSESDSLMYSLVDIYKTLLLGYWGIGGFAVVFLAIMGLLKGMMSEVSRSATLCAICVALSGTLPIIVGHVHGAAVLARYSLFALPFVLMIPALGADFALQRLTNKEHYRVVAVAMLPLMLLAGMIVQKRSPYDLERFKQSRPEWPSIEE